MITLQKLVKFMSCQISTAIRGLFGERVSLALWNNFVDGVQDATSSYLTYHLRPKYATSIQTQTKQTKHLPLLAIVMQGPIITIDDFTLNTFKLYKYNFPNTLLILSTWNDQPSSILHQFEHLGVQVVINSKPDYSGISNINLQIVSSKAGIERARNMGAEYALKTRTDQRMYAPNIAEFLYNTTQHFPVRGDFKKQQMRIVGCCLNTFKHRMYGLSDMFIYGHIEDMWLYWNVELDQRVFTADEIKEAGVSLESFARWRACEVYLATEFLTKIGRDLNWTLEDSWAAFSDNFCVIDSSHLDLFWNKYSQREYRWLSYDSSIKFQELTFREWLNLYCN